MTWLVHVFKEFLQILFYLIDNMVLYIYVLIKIEVVVLDPFIASSFIIAKLANDELKKVLIKSLHRK